MPFQHCLLCESKIHHRVVRPVNFNCSEYWPAINDKECRLAVMLSKVLLGISSVTHYDNEHICDLYGVVPIVVKLREAPCMDM